MASYIEKHRTSYTHHKHKYITQAYKHLIQHNKHYTALQNTFYNITKDFTQHYKYFTKTLHNRTQLYTNVHNSTQLLTIVQNFCEHICTKLHKTLQNYSNL